MGLTSGKAWSMLVSGGFKYKSDGELFLIQLGAFAASVEPGHDDLSHFDPASPPPPTVLREAKSSICIDKIGAN